MCRTFWRAINIDNPPSHTAIALDDRSDTAARNMIIGTSPTDSGEGYISGLAPANINYRYIDTSSLTIDTDAANGNAVNVQSTAVAVVINGGVGSTTFNVGDSQNRLVAIQAGLTVNGQGSSTVLNVEDQVASDVGNYYVTGNTVDRTGAARIGFTGLASLVLNTASGTNSINLGDTGITPVTVDTGSGSNTVNAVSLVNAHFLTVNGVLGVTRTTLNLHDESNADFTQTIPNVGTISVTTRPTYLVTSHSVTRSDARTLTDQNNQVTQYLFVSSFNFSHIAGLNVFGGMTPNLFNVQSTAAC